MRLMTADGFEAQLSVNLLTPFALTAQLLPGLVAAPAARVVMLTSFAAGLGRIRLNDLNSENQH